MDFEDIWRTGRYGISVLNLAKVQDRTPISVQCIRCVKMKLEKLVREQCATISADVPAVMTLPIHNAWWRYVLYRLLFKLKM